MFFTSVKRILHLLFYFILFMCAFLACILCTTHVHGAGVTDGCVLPRGCWELALGPLQEQQMLFNHQGSLWPQLEF